MTTEDVQEQIDEALCDYELTIIVRADATDEEAENAVEAVGRYVTDKGGSILGVDSWGKRRLAYPIKHSGEGTYVLTKFRIRPEYNRELESNLRISEDVIRHLLIKLS